MILPSTVIRLTSILAGVIACASATRSLAQPTIFGVQNRASTPNFQLFNHINDDSTIANPDSPLFTIAGGIYGATLKGGVFYGIELENDTNKEFLVTIPTNGDALGARVGEDEIGFSDIEGLANVRGQLYAVSLDYTNHVSRLITIDHVTGIGSLVAETAFDIMLVGLAFDPGLGALYGVGIPFGNNNSASLYNINGGNGETRLIGDLGTTIQSLAWSRNIGLVGSFDHLYSIDTSTGIATQIGSTDYTDGLGTGSEIFNGVYALAAVASEELTPVSISSIETNDQNEIVVTWASESRFVYRIEMNDTLEANNWTAVSLFLLGESGSMDYILDAGAPLDPRFYRVSKSHR